MLTVARRPGDGRVPADNAAAVPVLERPQRVLQAAVLREQVDRGAAYVGVPREPVLPGGAVELLGEGERRGGGGAGGDGAPVGVPARAAASRPRRTRSDEIRERGREVREAVRGAAARHSVERVVGARGGGG